MTSFRRLRLLALLTAAAWSLPSLHAQFGDPPGGGMQELQMTEAPPALGGCPPPVSTMGTVQHRVDGAEVTVQNRTSTPAQDFLVLDLTVEGQKRLIWTTVALKPGATVRLSIKYLKPVQLPGIGLCATRPGGIVDSNEPVGAVFLIPVE